MPLTPSVILTDSCRISVEFVESKRASKNGGRRFCLAALHLRLSNFPGSVNNLFQFFDAMIGLVTRRFAMKRLLWSLAGGLILPTSYFFILPLLEDYFPLSSRKTLQLPIAWPRLIYFQAFPPIPNSPNFYDTLNPYLFVFMILCNLVAYSVLVYLTYACYYCRK
jgi:hypothetical protein